MNKKPKTLKDMDFRMPYIDRDELHDKHDKECKEKLRQEAIKEIKFLQTDMKTTTDLVWEKLTGNTINYSEEGKQAIIRYIKWKNNITEEILKND